MLDNMTMTQVLAALIGLYFLSAGTGLLVERDKISAMFQELNTQPMLGYIGGLFAFAIGGAMVAAHNDWSGPLSGCISLIGWVALAEGVLMLACRRWFLGLFDQLTLSTGFVTAIGAATVLFGLLLLIAGLSG